MCFPVFFQQCYEAGTPSVPILQVEAWRAGVSGTQGPMATRWKPLPSLPPLNPSTCFQGSAMGTSAWKPSLFEP